MLAMLLSVRRLMEQWIVWIVVDVVDCIHVVCGLSEGRDRYRHLTDVVDIYYC